MIKRSVYTQFEGDPFGIDVVTPVRWIFTNRRIAPKSAQAAFSLVTIDTDELLPRIDPEKLNAMPVYWFGSYNQLRRALARDEVSNG